MGKPTAADLNLGIATAPVLFAAIEVWKVCGGGGGGGGSGSSVFVLHNTIIPV